MIQRQNIKRVEPCSLIKLRLGQRGVSVEGHGQERTLFGKQKRIRRRRERTGVKGI